jgi:NitT/TauT family transport system permease protein
VTGGSEEVAEADTVKAVESAEAAAEVEVEVEADAEAEAGLEVAAEAEVEAVVDAEADGAVHGEARGEAQAADELVSADQATRGETEFEPEFALEAAPEPSSHALEDVEAGLDALETTPEREGGRAAAVLRAAYPPVLALGLILAVWQALYAAKIWPDWKLPGPSDVFSSLKDTFSSGDAWPAVGHSVEHGAVGFGASVVIGTVLGLVVGRVRPVRAGVGPILSGLQSLPSVAWVPPALMFFGPKPAMLYGVVLLGAVPSIAVGVVSGLDQVPPLYLRVGRNLGARGLASVRYVLLPAALPGYLAGLRQGWAFAWRSLLAAEIIVQSADLGHSLGFLLKNAQDANDMAGAFAAIALILAVGVAVNQLLFVPLERRVLRSRGLA